MQINILNPNTYKKTLIFFSGFGSNPSFFHHLDSKDYRVIFISNYENNQLDLSFLDNQEVFLIGWSMGVAMANHFLPKSIKVKKSLAINGTNFGIHKTLGIPPTLFSYTIKSFNQDTFNQKIFCNNINKAKDFIFNPNPTLELQNLYNTLTQLNNSQNQNFQWDKMLISQEDEIFQSKYQINAWKEQNYLLTNAPHFVFFDYYSWEELCNL